MSREDPVDVQEEIDVHVVTDGPDTVGWVHTHGMNKFGLPELEIRNVPLMLSPFACGLLNEVAFYMINEEAKIKIGETMQCGPSAFRFEKLEPIASSMNHYEHERWTLTDVLRGECVECSCSNCRAKREDEDQVH